MDVVEAHNALMWMLDIYTRPMIGVAVRLGIPDALSGEARTAAEFASISEQNPEALERMMRALSARGVFQELPDGRFALTPLSEILRSGVPGTLRAMALWRTTESAARVAEAMEHSIRTGEPAVVAAVGRPFFDNLASRPEELEIFTSLMAAGTNPGVMGNRHAIAAESEAFDGAEVVVDVAGGRGQLLSEVLRRRSSARGILVDREEVVASAGEFLAAGGVADRVELVVGDFFQSVPAGGDVYTLSLIMHDWQDEECRAILRNIHAAGRPGSKVLVIERVLPPPGQTSPSFDHDTTQDINMMVGVGGRERTAKQYSDLLESTGFRFVRDWETGSPIHLLEGRRI